MVLQQMQMLDQQIALARAVAEQRLHLGERVRLDLPALRHVAPAAPAGARMNTALCVLCLRHVSP